MIFAILPVKSPQNAKQRLTGFLTREQREMLARTLYRQTLAALCRAKGIDRVVVATSDPEVAGHARESGALVIDETEQVSHSVSADAACLRAMEMGATTAMLVPIDVPTVTPDDFTTLAGSARPGLIVVPSSDGTGTNALVRTPPDCIRSRFGPGSFRAHLDQAVSKGLPSEVLRLPGLMFDIDTPEDVADFLSMPRECSVSAFLRSACALKS
ncbi:MAG TPA: 2-phospho-L-lactate guanylyltransferase [Bryobacteraceae bacterium]|nr:2-phospho-L-lactate guanylyltransferase [Bryobacteraceae bacterium]